MQESLMSNASFIAVRCISDKFSEQYQTGAKNDTPMILFTHSFIVVCFMLIEKMDIDYKSMM